MDSKNVALGAFVVLTLVFASIAAVEYSRGPSLTITRTLFSTTTSTEMATTTTTSTTVSTTSLVSISTVTATSASAFAFSVHVDRFDYTTNEPILVSGSVSPVPQPPTYVFLSVIRPDGNATSAISRVGTTNGSYTYALMAGGSPFWVSGVYTVVATCVAFGATETATTQFAYVVPA